MASAIHQFTMEALSIDLLGIILGHVELGRYDDGDCCWVTTLIDMLPCVDCGRDGIPCAHLVELEVDQAVKMRLVCKKWDQAIRRRFSHYARMTKYDCCR